MKYVIFDIDGTLSNTKGVDDKCFIAAFKETFGIDIKDEKWEDLRNVTDWGITEEIIQREKGRLPTAREYDLMVHNHVGNLEVELLKDKAQFQEIQGAKEFFDELRMRPDVKLGIATGAWQKSALIKLKAIGIELDGFCFSNSDHFKSREEITSDVIRQLDDANHGPAKQILYFGDGAWDFKTCLNLEIDFIGIDVNSDHKLRSLGAEIVFTNYVNKIDIQAQVLL